MRRTIISMILIMLGIMACAASLFIVIDVRCNQQTELWLPLYPNAQIIKEAYNFRRRASGITVLQLISPDDPTTVRNWYNVYRSGLIERKLERPIVTTNMSVVTNPDGAGSLISLTSECAQH